MAAESIRSHDFVSVPAFFEAQRLCGCAVIEIDLRLSSMVPGKKGFERVVWAFKHILNHSVAWLFVERSNERDSADGGGNYTSNGKGLTHLAAHHLTSYQVAPKIQHSKGVLVPQLRLDRAGSHTNVDHDHALDLLEWLSLVSIQSPRVENADAIDPFLSRFDVPKAGEASCDDLVVVSWTGLLPSQWSLQLLIAAWCVFQSVVFLPLAIADKYQ